MFLRKTLRTAFDGSESFLVFGAVFVSLNNLRQQHLCNFLAALWKRKKLYVFMYFLFEKMVGILAMLFFIW